MTTFRFVNPAGLLKRILKPAKKAPHPSFDFYLAQLTDQQVYLTNYGYQQVFRPGAWRRFIFVVNQRAFDVFFERNTEELSKLSWSSLDSFKEDFRESFALDTIPRYLEPFSTIPTVLLTTVLEISEKVDRLALELQNPVHWIELKSASTSAKKNFLHHTKASGYYTLWTDGNNPTKTTPRTHGAMIRELTEAVLFCPALEATPADIGITEKCEHALKLAEDCISRLEKGEILEMTHDSSMFRFYIGIAGNIFYVHADDGRVGIVREQGSTSVLEQILDSLIRLNRPPKFISLPAALMAQTLAITDEKKHFQAIRDGLIRIGGGGTSDGQWSISFTNGRFQKTSDHEHTGTAIDEISERSVKKIIRKKQYGWVRGI